MDEPLEPFGIVRATLEPCGGELAVHVLQREGSTQQALLTVLVTAPFFLGIAIASLWLGGAKTAFAMASTMALGGATLAAIEVHRARTVRRHTLRVRPGRLCICGEAGLFGRDQEIPLDGLVCAEVRGRSVYLRAGDRDWNLGFGLRPDDLDTLARAIHTASRADRTGEAPAALRALHTAVSAAATPR